MSRPDIFENNLYFANSENQNIKAVFENKLHNLCNLTIDKINEYEMNVVNSLTEWTQQEKQIFLKICRTILL